MTAYHIEPIVKLFFVNLGFLTLPCLYIFQCLIHVKANIGNYMLQTQVHNRDTRYKNNIYVDFQTFYRTKNGINYWGPRFYNKLPSHIRELDLSNKDGVCDFG